MSGPFAGPAEWRNSAPPTQSPHGGYPPNGPPMAAISPEYSQWARNQRPRGNVYGGSGNPGPTLGPPAGYPAAGVGEDVSVEHTGSLTGRILAYGRPDTTAGSGNVKVVLIMLSVLAAVVIATVVAAVIAGNRITSLLGG